MTTTTFTETELAAIKQIALHAFLDDLGADEFMALNVDGLVRFRERHGLDVDTMNTAWEALQSSWRLDREAAQARVLDAWLSEPQAQP